MIHELCIDNPRRTPVPYWHKVDFLKGQKRFEFRPGLNIIYGPNGCLADDTFVQYEIRTPNGDRQNHKGGTIEHLFRLFHEIRSLGKGYDQRPETVDSVFFAPSVDEEGRIFQNRIVDVVKTGDKTCLTIVANGGSITATGDHKFWTGERFLAATELRVGDTVHIHNDTRHNKAEQAEAGHLSRVFLYVKHHPVAGVKVVRDNAHGYRYEYRRLLRLRAVVEARLNGLDFDAYVTRLNEGHLDGLTFLRRDQKVHPLDEDYTNDSYDNLVVIDHREHVEHHSVDHNAGRLFSSIPVTITDIVSAGTRSTFDIKMESPFNNYIANGFVVHNSGKSTMLTGLAILMHCWRSNWPRVSKESIMDFFRPVGLCDGMTLAHDGSPARYLGIEPPGWPPEKGVEDLKLYLKLSSDMRGKSPENMSHGQATVSHLVRFLRAKPERVKYSFTRAKATKRWAPIYEVGIESIKNVRKDRGVAKQQVILLDEVDRSLDFAKQAAVWKQLRLLADTHQIIIASHSPFAVSVPGAHYIETTENYLRNSRLALGLILEDLGATAEAA